MALKIVTSATDNISEAAFAPTEVQLLLAEIGKLRPVGVAIIVQTADNSRCVAATFAGIDPAALQYGIRILQLQADEQIHSLLEDE